MSTYEKLADLPLRVDAAAFERFELEVASGLRRVTSVVRLRGGGHDGAGEDVTYESEDQDALQAAGAPALAGRFTLRSFSARVDEALAMLPAQTRFDARDYRRWAFESAGLDLALRQADATLGGVLGREPRPARFVVSMGLGSPPSLERVRALLDAYPTTRFKLDPTSAWTDELVAELRALGVVDVADLKGYYRGTPVDQELDLALYRRVAEGLPDAVIEDPLWDERTDALLRPYVGRCAWDAPIHSVADVEALPVRARRMNAKPSRFGSLERLFVFYDHAEREGIALYGGGQFELGPGRGQIQVLASLFHPDAPNDVAPAGYHVAATVPGRPVSPLEPDPSARGFRRLAAPDAG